MNKMWLLGALLLLSACGKESGSQNTAGSEVREEQVELVGEYKAILRPFNTQVNGFIPTGAAEFSVRDGELKVITYLDDDASVHHRQSLHAGSSCPTDAQDSNNDGLVDSVEALSIVGEVLIPLDGDLSSRVAGKDVWPRGKSFTYSKSTPLQNVLNDFAGSPLNLEGKVVMIHGTSEGSVPETVQTLEGLPRHLSLPIACGIIRRR